MMLRSIIARRRFCTSTPTSATAVFHERVKTEFENLMNADWVDTDEQEPVELVVESCDGVINEYRKYYDPAAPQDELYNDVAALHFAKEAASVTESYGELAERTLRRHEGMVGFLGNNTQVPEGGCDDTIALIRDYIKLMNTVEDERIRAKLETELGRKMMHLKMAISVENFSVEIAPLACDRIIPVTPQPQQLPAEPDKKPLPSS